MRTNNKQKYNLTLHILHPAPAGVLLKVKRGELALDNNFKKGNFGEMSTDVELAQKGYKPLHSRITDITKAPSKGIDGVFEKDGQYFIVESKFKGWARLSKDAADGPQMSDAWINGSDRILNAVGEENRKLIQTNGYKRVLSEVSPEGKIIYKGIDALGNPLNQINL